MTAASQRKNLLSASQAHPKPTNDNIKRKSRNFRDSFVSCINRDSHSAGSKTIYEVNKKATTMVRTKGTISAGQP